MVSLIESSGRATDWLTRPDRKGSTVSHNGEKGVVTKVVDDGYFFSRVSIAPVSKTFVEPVPVKETSKILGDVLLGIGTRVD